jgi:hypothetical protein
MLHGNDFGVNGRAAGSSSTPQAKEEQDGWFEQAAAQGIVRTYFKSNTCDTREVTITASKLRENVYQILDSILETGEAVEVVRKGRVLRIVADTASSRLGRLKKRDCIKGNPEDLVEIDWSKEWTPQL